MNEHSSRTTDDRNRLMRAVSDLLHAKNGKALSDGKILRVLEAIEMTGQSDTTSVAFRIALEKAESAMRMHGWHPALRSTEFGASEAFAAWEAVDEALHPDE